MSLTLKSLILATFIAVMMIGTFGTMAEASLIHDPLQPNHEQMITIYYSPEPGDDTSVVRLYYIIDNGSQNDVILNADPITGTYSYELGIYLPGTSITYSLDAGNRTVGQENITVASILTIQWHTDIEKARELALKLERPMFVFFYSDSDKDSYNMELETFTDYRVLDLSAEFIAVRVNVDMHEDIANDPDPNTNGEPSVYRTPTVIFYDNQTKEHHRVRDLVGPTRFFKEMEFALGRGPMPKGKDPLLFESITQYLMIMAIVMIVAVGVIFVLVKIYHRPL